MSPPQVSKFCHQLKCLYARVIGGINAKWVAIYAVDGHYGQVQFTL
ncbi:flagellar biosynthesis protein FlgA [Escherichia coli]|nr:flagellar biosynthesis protein FlgA [Escherichia coli]